MKSVTFNIKMPEGAVSLSRSRVFSKFAVWNEGPMVLADFYWKSLENPGPLRSVFSAAFYGPLLKSSVEGYKQYLAETANSIDLEEMESFKVGAGNSSELIPEMFDVAQVSRVADCGEVCLCQYSYHRVLAQIKKAKGDSTTSVKAPAELEASNLSLMKSTLAPHLAFVQSFIEAIQKSQSL